jgi:cardiolipin-specific phospholipase
MWPFSASSTLDSVKKQMQTAESQLLTLAKNFVLPSSKASAIDISLHDTLIPKEAVPHILPTASCFQPTLLTTDEHDDSYSIHSVQITSSTDDAASQESTPLVMLHGYMNASSYFYRNFVGLSQYFGTIHSLDLFGWGLSSRPVWPKQLTTKQAEDVMVESLEAWRQAKKIDKMILAGHSMGGYISVAYSEKYPQHVQRLILLSPAGVPEDNGEVSEKRKELIASRPWTVRFLFRLARQLFDAGYTPGSLIRSLSTSRGRNMVGSYVERRLPAITCANEREAVSDYLYVNSILPGSAEHSLSQFLQATAMARDPLVHRIPKLNVPHVTFLYGSHDWMDIEGGLQVQHDISKRQEKESVPRVQVYRVEQAGHLLMLDHWKSFNQGVILGAGGAPTDPMHVPTLVHPSFDHNQELDEDEPLQEYNEMNRMTRRATAMAPA